MLAYHCRPDVSRVKLEGLNCADKNRFTRQHRLLTSAAFSRVFEKAFRSRDKCFTVLCRDNESDFARLGLAIARKHCRKASGRNRIKRIVRESFRRHHVELGGLDVVVLNQPHASTAESAQLFDSLAAHWRRCAKARERRRTRDRARNSDTAGDQR